MFNHISVLLNECIDFLNINPDGIYVDGTAGGGGHSAHIRSKLENGKLICIDRDPDAIRACSERFKNDDRVIIVNDKFSNIKNVLSDLGIEKIDGLLLDLGVSSHQLDTAERGFSYHSDAPLDMRMGQEGLSASDIVNTYSAKEIADILFKYSDEKFSFKIANEIVKRRDTAPITTTLELSQIVSDCYPQKFKRDSHPARKTFQALRMAVNEELAEVSNGIYDGFQALGEGGRLVIITFHSIEDRLVKQEFASLCKGCDCPSDFPICVCHKTPLAKAITKKPVVASKEELEVNPRSRSAKVRVVQKVK